MSKWTKTAPAPQVTTDENVPEHVPTFAEQHAALMELRQVIENHTRVASDAYRAVRPCHNETLTGCRVEAGTAWLQFRISYGLDRGQRTVVLQDTGESYTLLVDQRLVEKAQQVIRATEPLPARPRGSARTSTVQVPDVMSRPRPTLYRLIENDTDEVIFENQGNQHWADEMALAMSHRGYNVTLVATQDGKLIDSRELKGRRA